MRLLYITGGFPYPLTTGYLRHYHLLRELSRRHEVTLLSVVGPAFEEAHRAAVAPFTERILVFPSSSRGLSRSRKAGNQLRALLRGEPIERAALRMRDEIARMRRTERFDAAIFSGKRTFPVLSALDGVPVVADICDADSVRLRGAMRHAGILRLPVLLVDYARVRRIERALLARSGHAFFASGRDRDALLGGPTPGATVVPNGVDVAYWKRTRTQRGRATLVFTGAMRYPPNEDAALFLIRRILPLVRRERPDARLLVVGREPTPRLRRAGRRPGVVVTGSVEDVRPYLEDASVFVAPIRFGAGIQNKLLEALAMELPAIASPVAAEGLRTDEDGAAPVAVARSARQFADLVLERLAACDRDPAPFAEGRRFVERNFVWRRAAERIEGVLAALDADRGGLSGASSPSSRRSSPAGSATVRGSPYRRRG